MPRPILSSAFSPVLRRLFHVAFNRQARRKLGRNASSTSVAASSRRLCLEALEDRITPTTFTPTSFLDDGTTNSLRGAITQANNDSGTATDTIQLAAGTYTLSIANTAGHENANTQGDLNITNTSHALIIQGTTDANGNPTSIIDQTALDRVFEIAGTNTTVTFKNLLIEGGKAQDDGTAGTAAGTTTAEGGGILGVGGIVTLSNVVLKNNSADAGTHFNANGGGIFVGTGGSLTVQSSLIQADGVFGGAGGTSTTNANGGSAEGGGIYADVPTSIANSNLSDNIVTGGNASISDGAGGFADGGGIYVAAPTTIINSILADNILNGGGGIEIGGEAGGGGVFLNTGITMTITASSLSGNTLNGGSSSGEIGGNALGGGVDLEANSTATITASTLSDNTLAGGNGNISDSSDTSGDGGGSAEGGGVLLFFGATLTISTSTLSGNTLAGGNGSLDNTSAIIRGNIGGSASGGGIYAEGPTTITTCILSDNTLKAGNGNFVSGTVLGTIGGSAEGGGVDFSPLSDPENISITASTLSGNTLTAGSGSGGDATPGLAQGGGAYFVIADATIINSTIVNNKAVGGPGTSTSDVAFGGGVFFGSMTSATLTNATVADNTTALPQGSTGGTIGGGIDNNAGSVTLVNTLVALNTALSSPDYAGTVSDSDHNLIGISTGSTGFSAANGDQLGSTGSPLDPHLGALATNGGPTETLALLPGSPALNAGDNNAQTVTGPFDQRGQGFSRVVNGTIDIGAFEVQPSAPPPSPPSPTSPPTLHTPPLLALIDSLLGGVETVNGNGTETVTDRVFGITLFVSTYDSSGNLSSVTIFGFNVTFLFELPI